jgi:sugar phosphate permease
MGKKFIFNIILNLIIILSVVVGSYFFKRENYLIPIVCLAAFGLTVFYKLKLIKQIKIDMKAKALENTKTLSKK